MARQISWRGVLSPDGAGDGRPQRATWRPVSPITPPASIVEAVRAMQAGALLSLLEVVRAWLTRGALRDAFAQAASTQGRAATPDELDRLVTVALTVSTVAGLVAAAVWFWMSRVTARGSKWGRWGACLLLALALGVFFGGLLPTAGLLHQVLALVLLLVGVWAVVRLWHPDSSAWIRYQTTPQP
jgi:uncharacterized membrane protein (UPF0136 family)